MKLKNPRPKTMKVKVCDQEMELKVMRSVAIRAYCTDCSCGSPSEVKQCPVTWCPLYIFRGAIRIKTDDSVAEIEE